MRRVLVTGANKGIGLAIVEALLVRYPDVFCYLGCRNQGRANNAMNYLVSRDPSFSARIQFLPLDVASDASVEGSAVMLEHQLKTSGDQLYGIVNNAGIFSSERGAREVIDVNVFGLKRVFDEFSRILKKSDARVVNIASASGPNHLASADPGIREILTNKNVNWEDIADLCEQFSRQLKMNGADDAQTSSKAYGFSKACANALTIVQARTNPTIKINSCTPGFIETDLTRTLAAGQGKSPSSMGMKQPRDGVESTIFLLMSADALVSGQYFGSDCKRSPLDRYRAPGDEPFLGDAG